MKWAVAASAPTLLVSDTGRVVRMASSRRRGRGWQTFPELELRPRRIGAGYLAIDSKEQNAKRTLYLHRLVAEAFLVKPTDANEVNHIDGDKQNNNLANLEWTTHSANLQHAYKEGLHKSRSLTPEQVQQARARVTQGYSLQQVAAEFGVSRSAISHLKQGRSWAWLGCSPTSISAPSEASAAPCAAGG